MPKLSKDDWEQVRAEREAGASFGSLARRFDISRQGIQKRAVKEGWGDGSDVSGLIRKQVAAKVAGVVDADPAKKALAIDAAADDGARIILQHRQEWAEHRTLFPLDGLAVNFDKGKTAKISAEMLGIRQKHERQAWGLDVENDNEETIVIERSYGRDE
jgi:hypothetical protein